MKEKDELKGLPIEKTEGEKDALRSWSVKLSERVIEDIETLYQLSGSRYKNEFVEKLIEKHKVNLMKEGGRLEETFLHPGIANGISQDLHELSKLSGMMQHLYVTQAEKFSMYLYEMDRMQKEQRAWEQEKRQLQEKIIELQHDIDSKKEFGLSQIEHIVPPPHTALFGITGSGKTITVKKEVLRHVEDGGKVIVIDNDGEFNHLTEQAGGTVITQREKGLYNPLSLASGSGSDRLLEKKIHWLMALFEMNAEREMTSDEKKDFIHYSYAVYKTYGITNNENIQEGQTTPSMDDYGLSDPSKQSIYPLVPLLKRIGDRSKLLDTYSETEWDSFVWPDGSPIVSFDLSQVTMGTDKNSAYFILFEQITRYLNSHPREDVLLVIHDSLFLLDAQANVESIRQLFRKISAFDTRILFVGSEPRHFLRHYEQEKYEFLQYLFFQQSPRSKVDLLNHFGLKDDQLKTLQHCQAGLALLVQKHLICWLDFRVDDAPETKNVDDGNITFSLF